MRVIVAVKEPADVVAISGNEQCQRAVLKFCTHTGATPIAGRFTPGTLTNQITSSFREPRLLIVSDPIIDHQPIAEARYVSIPTLAFCNTNANLKYIRIPCNREYNHSIGLQPERFVVVVYSGAPCLEYDLIHPLTPTGFWSQNQKNGAIFEHIWSIFRLKSSIPVLNTLLHGILRRMVK